LETPSVLEIEDVRVPDEGFLLLDGAWAHRAGLQKTEEDHDMDLHTQNVGLKIRDVLLWFHLQDELRRLLKLKLEHDRIKVSFYQLLVRERTDMSETTEFEQPFPQMGTDSSFH
jgi:hypothetical protein